MPPRRPRRGSGPPSHWAGWHRGSPPRGPHRRAGRRAPGHGLACGGRGEPEGAQPGRASMSPGTVGGSSGDARGSFCRVPPRETIPDPGSAAQPRAPQLHSRVRCCCRCVHAGRRFARFCPDPRGLHAEEQRGSLGPLSRVDVPVLDAISNEPAASQRDCGFFRIRERWSSGAVSIPGTVFFRCSRLPQRSSAGSQRSRPAGLRPPTGVMRTTVPLLQEELAWGLRACSDNAG